jgi:hypothetical protein
MAQELKCACPKCGKSITCGKRCWKCKQGNRTMFKERKKRYLKSSIKCRDTLNRGIHNYQKTLNGTLSQLISRAKCRKRMHLNVNIDPQTCICEINKEFLLKLWNNQNGKCAISNIAMSTESHDLCKVSLDRIDSSFGYIESNVQLVCKWVNLAKSNASNTDMIEVIAKIKAQT